MINMNSLKSKKPNIKSLRHHVSIHQSLFDYLNRIKGYIMHVYGQTLSIDSIIRLLLLLFDIQPSSNETHEKLITFFNETIKNKDGLNSLINECFKNINK